MKSYIGNFGTYYGENSYDISDAEQKANAIYIYKSMNSRGWSFNAICGILGNMQVESTINPARWQSGKIEDKQGYGLVQWTPSTNFLSWAKKNNKDELMDGQLAKIQDEHDNGGQFFAVKDPSKADYGDGINYNITFKEFSVSTLSPYILGRIFGRNYERSGAILKGGYDADKSLTARGNYATEWYNYLNKNVRGNNNTISSVIFDDMTGYNCEINTQKDIGLSLWSDIQKTTRIIRVAKGQIISVKEDFGNGWVLAQYNGKTGYVDKQYLIKKDKITVLSEEETNLEIIPEEIQEEEELNETLEYLNSFFVPAVAIQTKSRCYVRARSITPKGILVHSTGCVNRDIKRYVYAVEIVGKNEYGNHWNKDTANKSMHGWVGYDKDQNVIALQALPYNIACWGCGGGKNGSYNYDATSSKPRQKAHLQFEICEGSKTDSEYYWKAIEVAENYCVYLCKKFGFTIDNITTHKEAAEAGFASNHGDPQSYMKNFGDSITKFRNRIAVKLGNTDIVIEDTSNIEITVPLSISNYPTIKFNSSGNYVKILQNLLNQCGYSLEIDGKFGNLTKIEVMKYQQSKGLVADGIVGKKTWTALENEGIKI